MCQLEIMFWRRQGVDRVSIVAVAGRTTATDIIGGDLEDEEER